MLDVSVTAQIRLKAIRVQDRDEKARKALLDLSSE